VLKRDSQDPVHRALLLSRDVPLSDSDRRFMILLLTDPNSGPVRNGGRVQGTKLAHPPHR